MEEERALRLEIVGTLCKMWPCHITLFGQHLKDALAKREPGGALDLDPTIWRHCEAGCPGLPAAGSCPALRRAQ